MNATAAHLLPMLHRVTHQPKIREAPARVLAPPALRWSKRFAQPIPVQNGKPLVTLRDTATYIAALPEAEQHAPEWQTPICARAPGETLLWRDD